MPPNSLKLECYILGRILNKLEVLFQVNSFVSAKHIFLLIQFKIQFFYQFY